MQVARFLLILSLLALLPGCGTLCKITQPTPAENKTYLQGLLGGGKILERMNPTGVIGCGGE